MSTSEASSSWDFTPVIDLLHSFKLDSPSTSSKPESNFSSSDRRNESASRDAQKGAPDDAPRKLGDFGGLWEILAKPLTTETFQPNGDGQSLLDKPASREPPAPVDSEDADDEAKAQLLTVLKKAPFAPKRILVREKKEEEKSSAVDLVTSTPQLAVPPSTSKTSPSKNKRQVESILGLTPEERKADLLSKLRVRFQAESKYLKNPELCDTSFGLSNTSPTGIHVFVDMSNIMVGFHDCVKVARDIPITVRVPRVPLSFHNFLLVLERGRPTSKRILVGSDRFAAIDEAGRLGYETNILERVHKAKEYSARHKQALNVNAHATSNSTSKKGCNGTTSSGSETNTGPTTQRWVEQAVDEILHLKILESLVDAQKPSTIVLATGDAAEAEYSEGFLRMVERALQKGWKVELVSFSSTTSRAYRRKDFRSRWGSKFVMIDLDEFAEHLVDL